MMNFDGNYSQNILTKIIFFPKLQYVNDSEAPINRDNYF